MLITSGVKWLTTEDMKMITEISIGNTFLHLRRPVEERVVHALGKAWHVEVNKLDIRLSAL